MRRLKRYDRSQVLRKETEEKSKEFVEKGAEVTRGVVRQHNSLQLPTTPRLLIMTS
jgi:hypothetical protein